MKPRSGMESERYLLLDLGEGLWKVKRGHRTIGLVRWKGAVPFKVAIKVAH